MSTANATRGRLILLVPLGREPKQEDTAQEVAGGQVSAEQRVIGLLDEGWARPYFAGMRPFFQERWGEALDTRYWKKPLMSAPSPARMIEEIAQSCESVIVGVGH